MEFAEHVHQRFTARNWRLTLGVRNVINVLDQEDTFLAASEIEEMLASFYRKIDPVTVYRILKKLKEAEVVHELNGKWIKCTDPENTDDHHFLICTECGKAEEIFLDYKEAIGKQLAAEKNFVLKDVHLSFTGVCENCLKD